jgi:4'-phosphopantetheinyl transferase
MIATAPATPRWTLLPHARGEPAVPRVQDWLARSFGGEAGDYAFERDAHGRPQLRGIALDCNWSHSGGHLLVAAGNELCVGVDLESLRPRASALALARRFFAAEETLWLASRLDARDADVERDFLRLWCAKEAVLKAHGRGLAFGLHRLAFAEENGALSLRRCDAELGAARDWNLREFEPAPGTLAALAWRKG